MNPALKKLYQEVIMVHSKEPFHFEKKENTDIVLEANNPLCGDRYTLYLNTEEDRIITAHFHGFGCAISKASTSILTEKILGKTLQEAKDLCASFLSYIDAKEDAAAGLRPKPTLEHKAFEAFSAVDEFPGRRSCAVLAWEILGSYENE